ncbi:dihydrofolate reductase [Bacteroidia bacterium]|nr:dihydrofolate reductase [Bacteroidia bacterium]GHV71600.1 dihydrofolate reductase [Bacteroidia bacterium]
MTISIIVAIGKNNEIGKGNDLLCRLSADLKHFKEITLGHTVVMGRKTFDSLPKGPLPNRRNVVISRNKDLKIEGAEVYSSLDYTLIKLLDETEVFIIGGAQIYEQTLPIADKLYLTKIHAGFPEADIFFPPIDWKVWREIGRETFPADEKNPYSFSFLEYERV